MTLSPDFIDRMGPRIAYWVMSQVTAIILIVAFVAIPKENQQLFNQIVTCVLGGYALLLAFLYGASVGSRAKDQTIATALSASTTSNTNGGTP